MAFILVVAGVPGVGKSTLASRLVRALNLRYTGIAETALEEGAWSQYDPKRRTFYIEFEKTALALRRRARRYARLLIEATEVVTVWEAGLEPIAMIILRSNPIVLYERLKRREWPLVKLVENIEAEFIGVVARQAIDLFGEKRVCEIDTSKRSPSEVLGAALKFLKEFDPSSCDRIDWTLDDMASDFVLKLASKLGYRDVC